MILLVDEKGSERERHTEREREKERERERLIGTDIVSG